MLSAMQLPALNMLDRRKTVTALDAVHALKRQGRTLYGFGVVPLPNPTVSENLLQMIVQ
jgi:hypothetical protein